MKIEVPIEEKPTPPKPKRKYKYKASVEYSSDRPKLMKLLWSLDDQAIMEAKSNWRFKIITTLTPLEMTSVMANCGFLCQLKKCWF